VDGDYYGQRKTPQKSSDEANAEQLGMAREESKAYVKSLSIWRRIFADAGGGAPEIIW
jgi:hypothetical protein